MFYEDVKLKNGDTVAALSIAYGYKGTAWQKIWSDPRNVVLVKKRGKPEHLQVNDILYIPIPWKVTSKSLTKEPRGAGMVIERDGEYGKRLTWVQTVNQANQPVPKTNQFCVDACPPDDDLPFYWTNAEIKADPEDSKIFSDHPSRNPPSHAQGTTTWRAVTSLAITTEKRISVWNSLVWGFDLEPSGNIKLVGPRAATAYEIKGHLNLLTNGIGTGPQTFGKAGWTFRSAQP